MHIHKLLVGAILGISTAVGCVLENPEDEVDTEAVGTAHHAVIVGDEDWDDVALHRGDHAYPSGYHHSRGVGEIGNCTAFLIDHDLIMTAHHCIDDNRGNVSRTSVTVRFGRERNVALNRTPAGDAYTCPQLVATSVRHDVAIYRCNPSTTTGLLPGDRWTILPLSRVAPNHNDDLYAVSFNCRTNDCGTIGSRLLFSPGGSGRTSGRLDKCEITDARDSYTLSTRSRFGFETDCDARPGSSGGPVLHRARGGGVIGIFSAEFSNIFTTHNKAGAVWEYVQWNDSDGDSTLDFAEYKVLIGDFNNDYRQDLVKFEMGSPGRVLVYLANGTGYDPPQLWANWWMAPNTHVVVGDFNGDHKDDILKVDNGSSAGVWVGLSTGSSFPTTRWTTWPMSSGTRVVAGDFTGDGRTDIVRLDNGSPGRLSLGRSVNQNGVDTFITTPWANWWLTTDTQVLVGDFDNNNRDDIMKFDNGSPGGVWVGLSQPWGLHTTRWDDWWMTPSTKVRAGDFNGDGKTDVMKIDNGRPGGVWVGLSSGSSFSTTRWSDWYMDEPTQLITGRFLGNDARFDIAKIDNQGNGASNRLWIGQSTGTSYSTRNYGPRWIQPKLDLLSADVNGDLKHDIVIFGSGGVVSVRRTP